MKCQLNYGNEMRMGETFWYRTVTILDKNRFTHSWISKDGRRKWEITQFDILNILLTWYIFVVPRSVWFIILHVSDLRFNYQLFNLYHFLSKLKTKILSKQSMKQNHFLSAAVQNNFLTETLLNDIITCCTQMMNEKSVFCPKKPGSLGRVNGMLNGIPHPCQEGSFTKNVSLTFALRISIP